MQITRLIREQSVEKKKTGKKKKKREPIRNMGKT